MMWFFFSIVVLAFNLRYTARFEVLFLKFHHCVRCARVIVS